MAIRVKDLLNLPNAIANELEYRSSLRAQALAQTVVNKLTGESPPSDPYRYNPYLAPTQIGSNGNSIIENGSYANWDKNEKQNWGSSDW